MYGRLLGVKCFGAVTGVLILPLPKEGAPPAPRSPPSDGSPSARTLNPLPDAGAAARSPGAQAAGTSCRFYSAVSGVARSQKESEAGGALRPVDRRRQGGAPSPTLVDVLCCSPWSASRRASPGWAWPWNIRRHNQRPEVRCLGSHRVFAALADPLAAGGHARHVVPAQQYCDSRGGVRTASQPGARAIVAMMSGTAAICLSVIEMLYM